MTSLDDVARNLANAHREADPDIKRIFQIVDPAGKEVVLLEVSDSVGFTGSIMPFRFAARPDLGIPYPSVVILLSPEEEELLDKKELEFPDTWGSTRN